MTDRELLNLAVAARDASYAPYSHFTVGAALLTRDGRAYTGCNIENASYGVTNCAERTALFTAVAAGEREFVAIAIAGGEDNMPLRTACPPCGNCRQALTEFCPPTLRVILGDRETLTVTTLGELLPLSFRIEDQL